MKYKRFFVLIFFIFVIISLQFKKIFLFLFVSFIHELSHLLVCKLFKVNVKKIEILPFGFQMDIENIEAIECYKQLLIYLAGPLSFFLNIILFKFLFFLDDYSITILKQANILMALFNLLPIFPLDGYHILNSLLNKVFSFKKALHISCITSLIFLFAFTIYNFIHPQLFLIIFLFFEQIKNIKSIKIIYRKFLFYKTNRKKHKKQKFIINYSMYKDINNYKIEKNKILNDYDIAICELKKIDSTNVNNNI